MQYVIQAKNREIGAIPAVKYVNLEPNGAIRRVDRITQATRVDYAVAWLLLREAVGDRSNSFFKYTIEEYKP